MDIRKGQELELVVDKIAHGGPGVARVDGFVVFVRGGVPGDRILGRVYRKKRGYAEAALLEVLEPSPDRTEPPCPYCGTCGGCQWQHIQYDAQLDYKRSHVKETVERIGGLQDVPVHPTVPSDRVFGYRNKMEFSFSDRRWLLPEELGDPDAKQGFALGLHVPGTFNKIIDVEACLLQAQQGNDILRAVKQYAKNSGLPAYGFKSHQGYWRFLTLRHSVSQDNWMVNVITAEDRPDTMGPLAGELKERFSKVRTVVNNITARKAAIAVGEREIVLEGDGFLEDALGGFNFRISSNSFFQTNTRGARALYDVVEDYAGLTGKETVFDLYCGTGTIGIYLSRKAARVIGVELDAGAVADALRNAADNGIRNCRFVAGDLREILADLEAQTEVLVIDPPRAGMHKDVLDEVLKKGSERVVYVSCNPASLARDLAAMSRVYKVLEIQPVDLFPHTYHIESVARLRRRREQE
jgi:23S rRNA (uracil1939-C5)-methyltransferase